MSVFLPQKTPSGLLTKMVRSLLFLVLRRSIVLSMVFEIHDSDERCVSDFGRRV